MDVQRIAVIGAEAQKGRSKLVDERHQRCQIFRDRSFADEYLHALGELLLPFGEIRGLVTVFDPAGEISVQSMAGKQRRVSVDVLALKGCQLLHAFGVFIQHARHIHELGQADHLGMVPMRYQVSRREPRAGCFELRRRNAG